ncbi:hypothetical protein PO124_12780 [Bacillus licheniformis]|nr:hypothetical protein [Bacillus licheniformis]
MTGGANGLWGRAKAQIALRDSGNAVTEQPESIIFGTIKMSRGMKLEQGQTRCGTPKP